MPPIFVCPPYVPCPHIQYPLPVMANPDDLHRLAADRWRIVSTLTTAVIVLYFGFILLVAWGKPLLGVILIPGLSVGILLGAFVIVAAWMLMLVYVRWANRHHDTGIAAARGSR
jgi:uncharacterized membrane protein (DUF485 family)